MESSSSSSASSSTSSSKRTGGGKEDEGLIATIEENNKLGKKFFNEGNFGKAEFFFRLVYVDCYLYFGENSSRTKDAENWLCRAQFEIANSRDKMSTPASDIKFAVKSGYLTKRGGRWKNWKRRWFILEGTNFYYYKEKDDPRPKGCVEIRQNEVTVVPETEAGAKRPCLKISCPDRTWYVHGESEADVLEWMDIISRMQNLEADVGELS